jgi:hypothetical protein
MTTDAAGNMATVSYDYDTNTLLLTSATCANNTPESVYLELQRTDNSKTYSYTIPPQTTVTQTIPKGQTNHLQLTVTPSGRLDGVTWKFWLI